MHQPDAQHPAGAGQPRVRKRRSVISIEHLRQAAAGDRPAQQILAGAGVLMREEPAVDQQPGMIIDDQEQPRPHRPLPPRVRHPRADQHVGDPPLVRPRSFVAPVRLGLGGQRLAVQPGPAQLAAHRPLGDRDPVPVIQDRGDLRGRPAGQLQPQRRGLGEQPRVGAHRAGVGPLRGLERLQPAPMPGPQPPVDRPSRVAPGRPVRVGVGGDPADQRSPFPGGQPVPGCLGDHRPAVQRDLFLSLVVHFVLLSCRHGGTGGMKRRLPTIRKGELVLAAISFPPVTDDANRHQPTASHPGKAAAAPNPAPIAASANRPASAGGRIASPPSSTASAANAIPSSPARPQNRRTHPRAVACGTPARAAAGRTPHPRRPPPRSPRRSSPPYPAARPARTPAATRGSPRTPRTAPWARRSSGSGHPPGLPPGHAASNQTRTSPAPRTTGNPGGGPPPSGQLPHTHRPAAGTAIRWPRATPPRIPPRDRRQTRRGGIPHVQQRQQNPGPHSSSQEATSTKSTARHAAEKLRKSSRQQLSFVSRRCRPARRARAPPPACPWAHRCRERAACPASTSSSPGWMLSCGPRATGMWRARSRSPWRRGTRDLRSAASPSQVRTAGTS